MEEGKHGRVVCVDSFPDEILIHIFSHFSFNELIDILQNVCVRWKRLVHYPTLWIDKEYIIRGRHWKPQGRSCCGVCFSECVHCRYQETDEQVLKSVGTMPQLRRLTVSRVIRGRVLRKFCVYCPNLTNLQIQCHQNVSYTTVRHIFAKCPKIEKLKLPASMLSRGLCDTLFYTLEHLKCLVVFEDLGNKALVRLRLLADSCLRLQEIHTNLTICEPRDLRYFLEMKHHTLTSVTLRWTVGLWRSTWCVVTLLKQRVPSLRKLRLLHFDVPAEMEAAAFEDLGGLHSLQELHAEGVSPCQPQAISLAFQPGRLTQLRRLQLQYASNLQDETVITISECCPNLRELRLKKSEQITDMALIEIHLLQHLEILELSGCSGLGGAAVAYIAQLPSLNTLVLQLFNDLTKLQPSLRHIVNVTELKCLDILQSRSITAVPFEEFPGRLVKLRELRVTYGGEDENVFTELQQRMPRLMIFNTFRLTEDDLSDNICDGVDEYYAGGGYYYHGDAGDNDDDSDDD